MGPLETLILRVHVAAGVVALSAGLGALLTAKGGLRHRQTGTVFVGSMGVTVGTVFVLLAFDPTPFRVFLTLVGVFSGYLAFSGYRVLSRKRPRDDARPLDWAGAVSVVLACLGLGGWGVFQLVGGDSFGVVLVAFGGIGLASGVTDIRTFRNGDDAEKWTETHLQRMIAAFIATVSAVSAVNLTPELGFVAWLWPTVVGVPLTSYWAKKYRVT
ncbi:hypothetical protein [Halorussus caseinilyticus]|uniref:DUF2306 domain-containing protein n=1 Tax=Halorussus caseinilyticus TaxID=3034025 RepID=A0ABD5WK85_9EURY|nr:hypothetical protein [Halorussus sp. DT72]